MSQMMLFIMCGAQSLKSLECAFNNYIFCFIERYKSSYKAAQHDVAFNAIACLEDLYGKSVRTCQYMRVCVTNGYVKK
jgi:hypothetical protein